MSNVSRPNKKDLLTNRKKKDILSTDTNSCFGLFMNQI